MIPDLIKIASKIKTYVLTIFIGLSLFLIINSNDQFQEIPISYQLLICFSFGRTVSKILDKKYVRCIDKHKSLKRCKSLIKRLKLDISKKGFTRNDKKILANLNKDAENILNNYEENIIDFEGFKKRINDLVCRYEKMTYITLELKNENLL